MRGKVLVPVGAGLRRRHQLLHDRLAFSLIARQRRWQIAELILQRLGQRQRIFHRQPGA